MQNTIAMIRRKYDVELFVLPIAFSTISFHHQSQYYIKLTVSRNSSLTIRGLYKQRQLYQSDYSQTLDRSGTAWNVGGEALPEVGFRTNRFQIDYNDQVVHFNTGVLIKLTVALGSVPQPIHLLFQLYKSQETIIKGKEVVHLTTPKDTVVSAQGLQINLGQETKDESLMTINKFSYRKIVFPTNQYISFLDINIGFTYIRSKLMLDSLLARENDDPLHEETQKSCCVVVKKRKIKDPEKIFKRFYLLMIEEKLKSYKELRFKTIMSMQEYQKIKSHILHSSEITAQFENEFLQNEPPQLDYVSVFEEGDERQHKDNLLESNKSLKKGHLQENANRSFREILSDHYQCEQRDIYTFICEESAIIELNIRSLFQRWTQIQFVLAYAALKHVPANQIQRMNFHITKAQDNIRKFADFKQGFLSLKSSRIPPELFQRYQKSMQTAMSQLTTLTRTQTKQPLLLTLSEPANSAKQTLNVDHTLTVFVHGYRGNQYDLSKMKSYLSLFFGFTKFYSIRNLNLRADEHISKLGLTAAEEIEKQLATDHKIRHINIVGFSMGGIVARAMLPHLAEHRDKFNLLVTLASPHLGISEIESCLVRAGLYYMREVSQVESIRELCHDQKADNSQFMLQLSSQQSIRWFSWIILVGSQEDSYIPIYSSLAQYEGDQQEVRLISNNLNSRIQGNVVKCLAKLPYKQSLWDVMTKRRPHIAFLEEDSFIRYFIMKFQRYFLNGKQKNLLIK